MANVFQRSRGQYFEASWYSQRALELNAVLLEAPSPNHSLLKLLQSYLKLDFQYDGEILKVPLPAAICHNRMGHGQPKTMLHPEQGLSNIAAE